MQPVYRKAVLGRGRLVAAAVAVAVLAGAVAIAAVSAGDKTDPSAGRIALLNGQGLQSARCRDWLKAGATERERVVSTLEQVVGGPSDAGGRGTILPTQQAHQLFDRACAAPQARGFLLYSIYTKAAAFSRTPEHFQ